MQLILFAVEAETITKSSLSSAAKLSSAPSMVPVAPLVVGLANAAGRDYGKVRDYSQEAFADACSLHRTDVFAIERGKSHTVEQLRFTI